MCPDSKAEHLFLQTEELLDLMKPSLIVAVLGIKWQEGQAID